MGEVYAPREAEYGALCVGAARFESNYLSCVDCLSAAHRRDDLTCTKGAQSIRSKVGLNGHRTVVTHSPKDYG